MFSLKKDLDRAVANTLDPAKRSIAISNLEKRMKLNEKMIILTLMSFFFSHLTYFLGGRDMQSLSLVLFVGLMLTGCFMAYTSTFNQLVQLKVEEERDNREA